MGIICLEHIAFQYGNHTVLKDINLDINAGAFIAVTGENGAGKSTLLNIISCMLQPEHGSVSYKGKTLNLKSVKVREQFRRDKVGIISQDFSLIYDMKVEDNIALPLKAKKLSKAAIRDRVEKMMQELGITNLSQKYPDSLSGGECQKVAIARALVKNPEIILADEPAASLDEHSKKETLRILKDLASKGIALIVVTHEKDILNEAQHIYKMQDGVLYMEDFRA